MLIYVDMDGVLVNFVDGALQILGMHRNDYDIGNYNGFGFTEKDQGVNCNKLWNRVRIYGEVFWRTLDPLMDDVKGFLKALEEYGTVKICSSPGTMPGACKGKLEWLQKHVRCNYDDYVFAVDKSILAHEDAVLIDDYTPNIKKFREWGGHAYKWKSNWEVREYTPEIVNREKLKVVLFLEDVLQDSLDQESPGG